MSIQPVILCGGAGKRLWPLSTDELPKQFIKIEGHKNIFSLTLNRLKSAFDVSPLIVSQARYLGLIEESLKREGIRKAIILLEPCARNTAAAIVASGLFASNVMGASSLAVFPSDHFIADTQTFSKDMHMACDLASQGHFVTFGISPTKPHTGYGYIKVLSSTEKASEVIRFTEKPDAPTAASFIASGNYFWNSGMFLLPLNKLFSEASNHIPDVFHTCQKSMANFSRSPSKSHIHLLNESSFSESPSISFDKGLMENISGIQMIRAGFDWDDIGDFESFCRVFGREENSNFLLGEVSILNCSNNIIISLDKPIKIEGIRNSLVVHANGNNLFVNRQASEDSYLSATKLTRN